MEMYVFRKCLFYNGPAIVYPVITLFNLTEAPWLPVQQKNRQLAHFHGFSTLLTFCYLFLATRDVEMGLGEWLQAGLEATTHTDFHDASQTGFILVPKSVRCVPVHQFYVYQFSELDVHFIFSPTKMDLSAKEPYEVRNMVYWWEELKHSWHRTCSENAFSTVVMSLAMSLAIPSVLKYTIH